MTGDETISSNSADPVIEIRDLHKSFGEQHVLTGLDLTLQKEENLVVLGKSGSGKSVLIKLVVGLIPVDKGTINILGKDVTASTRDELAEIRSKIGFLFQGGALYDSMSVQKNLEFPLRRIKKKMTEKDMHNKIMEVLENVGLADVLEKMPAELSGGQRKRIALARSIVIDPQVMLYDEPTTGLDPVTSNEISDLVLEIREKYKTSSIIITHDIACAKKVADRMVMLDDGKVHKEGTADEFIHSDDELVRSFFNSLIV